MVRVDDRGQRCGFTLPTLREAQVLAQSFHSFVAFLVGASAETSGSRTKWQTWLCPHQWREPYDRRLDRPSHAFLRPESTCINRYGLFCETNPIWPTAPRCYIFDMGLRGDRHRVVRRSGACPALDFCEASRARRVAREPRSVIVNSPLSLCFFSSSRLPRCLQNSLKALHFFGGSPVSVKPLQWEKAGVA